MVIKFVLIRHRLSLCFLFYPFFETMLLSKSLISKFFLKPNRFWFQVNFGKYMDWGNVRKNAWNNKAMIKNHLKGSRKKPPLEKKPPDSKPNPIRNLTLTLPLTLTGRFFPGRFFPGTIYMNQIFLLLNVLCNV